MKDSAFARWVGRPPSSTLRGSAPSRARLVVFLLGASALLLPRSASTQECESTGLGATGSRLTLADAERRALEGNRGLAADLARTAAAAARAGGAASFLWPSAAVEAGLSRTDDPVGAFGTRLRQGRFAQQDLALDALNHPTPVSDWVAAVGVRWSALDPARWAERSAAGHGARAATLGSARRAEAVIFRTRVLYLDAVAAGARLEAARAAERAAEQAAALVTLRLGQGLVTEADRLQAEAGRAGAEALVASAEAAMGDARGRLALHLGLPVEAGVAPVDTVLTAAPEEPGRGPTGAPELRADLEASRESVAAARAGLRRAQMSRLPTVEAFARLASHAREPFDRRERNLTVGVQLSLPLFTGGALSSAEEEARALETAAQLDHEERVEAARAEREEAARAVEAARRGSRAADAASSAAEEARRLVRRRFEEGVATTADLLRSEASAADFRTRAIDARVAYHQAVAALAFARGGPSDDAPEPVHD